MFCRNCGNQIAENDAFCSKCGTPTKETANVLESDVKKTMGNGIAIAGFVCSFFIPLLGWIFGGVGLSRAKKRNGKGMGFSIAAIAIASFMFIIGLTLPM